LELKTIKLSDIKPYKNNPRKNDQAVDAVMESIKQCGYVAPIIVDEDFVILAGHTRYKALKKLKKSNAEVIVRTGLSEEQKKKYRILDNKTSEFADWDFDLLETELEGLDFGEFDFGFGAANFTDDELESLMQIEENQSEKKYQIIVKLKSENEVAKVRALLVKNGYGGNIKDK
jgi:DNA-binding PadR family transcriptional regulator